MRVFLITLLLVSFLQSDEMQRIESIVQDITKLRAQYEECKDNLNAKDSLKAEVIIPKKDDSKISEYQKELKAEIGYLNESSQKSEAIIKKYKNQLKTKDNEILDLKNKLKNSNKTTSKKVKPAELCIKNIDENIFPKLMPKNNADIIEKVETTQANTFRLNSDSSIYDSPNGKEIYSWTKNTSFTSNKKTINWVKITGFFIDKKWKPAKEEMWIEHSQVSEK